VKKGSSMIRRRLMRFCLALVIVGICVPNVFAQTGYPGSGPISPWMNMFQRHPGPLDNYHSFVQPNLELQKTLTQQNAAIQGQQSQLQHLGQRMSEGQQEVAIPPTGTGSVFMDYSHFYPKNGVAAAAQRPASSRAATTSPISRGVASSAAASRSAR
jgi:hypothetical protein